MSHPEQMQFCKSVRERFPAFFFQSMVLDIGALDINGSLGKLFSDSVYLGVDIAPGKNVDIVCKAHELALPDHSFDVVMSSECFEHDMFYNLTLKNMMRLLKPGGLFFFTCATTGRPEHGTRRSNPDDAPLLQNEEQWADYYKNLEESDIRESIDIDNEFQDYEFDVNHSSHDLYFWGIKKGNFEARNNYSSVVRAADKVESEIPNEQDILVEQLTQKLIELKREYITLETELVNVEEELIQARDEVSASHEITASFVSLGKDVAVLKDINFSVLNSIEDSSGSIPAIIADIKADFKKEFEIRTDILKCELEGTVESSKEETRSEIITLAQRFTNATVHTDEQLAMIINKLSDLTEKLSTKIDALECKLESMVKGGLESLGHRVSDSEQNILAHIDTWSGDLTQKIFDEEENLGNKLETVKQQLAGDLVAFGQDISELVENEIKASLDVSKYSFDKVENNQQKILDEQQLMRSMLRSALDNAELERANNQKLSEEKSCLTNELNQVLKQLKLKESEALELKEGIKICKEANSEANEINAELQHELCVLQKEMKVLKSNFFVKYFGKW